MSKMALNNILKLTVTHTEFLQFWDYSRNSITKPDNVGLYSSRKVWWHHEYCATGEEHVWQAWPEYFPSKYQSF